MVGGEAEGIAEQMRACLDGRGGEVSARNAQSQASAVSTASAGRNTRRLGIARKAAKCSTG